MIPFFVEPTKPWWRRNKQRQGRSHFMRAVHMTLLSAGLLLLGGATLTSGQRRHDAPERNPALQLRAEARKEAPSSVNGSGQVTSKQVASGWVYVLDSNNMKAESQILVVDPSQGRIVRTFKTDSLPDMALSPDGARLYVASTRYSQDGNSSQGFLSIIDTKSGNLLSTVSNPDRWLCTGREYPSMMAFSKDGRWLYIFKHVDTRQADTYYVTTFDAKQNLFLQERLTLPGCVAATLVPLADRSQLAVACDGTRNVRFAALSGDGAITNLANTEAESARSRVSLASKGVSEHGRRIGPILPSPDGRTLTVIMGDGRYLRIDSQSHLVTQTDVLDRDTRKGVSGGVGSANGEPSDWMADSWIRSQTPAVSPDGEKLYLGVGHLTHLRNGVQSFDRVMVFDNKTLNRSATIRTSQAFESLALSVDGRYLYAISPQQTSIMVIDTNTQHEIRTINGIGTSPIWAIVAP